VEDNSQQAKPRVNANYRGELRKWFGMVWNSPPWILRLRLRMTAFELAPGQTFEGLG